MKKVMSSIVMAGILAATASAQEGVFVGVHYGSTNADVTASGSTDTSVESTGGFGLKAGYATTLEGIGGVRGYYTNDVIAWSNATASTSMLSADYLYKLPNMNNIEVFGGLSVGSASFEVDTWDSGSGSATGFQLGALFKRGGSSDYEVGYRIINTSAESTTSFSWFGTDYEYGLELTSISQLYVGANWYF